MKRTTVRLPDDLFSRAKRMAAAEGRTLTSLIEDALRLILSDRRGASHQDRLLPRISQATGGPKAGIDISNSAALTVTE